MIAGAHGVLKNLKDISLDLIQSTPYRIAVVCGHNHLLQTELDTLVSYYPDRFSVYGYVERMDELYRLASCIVTKPGGITLTESTAIGTPLVLYKPVPGQERDNAHYFHSKGAALIVDDQTELTTTIVHLLENKKMQAKMSSALKGLHFRHASSTIMKDILIESRHLSQILSNDRHVKKINKM